MVLRALPSNNDPAKEAKKECDDPDNWGSHCEHRCRQGDRNPAIPDPLLSERLARYRLSGDMKVPCDGKLWQLGRRNRLNHAPDARQNEAAGIYDPGGEVDKVNDPLPLKQAPRACREMLGVDMHRRGGTYRQISANLVDRHHPLLRGGPSARGSLFR